MASRGMNLINLPVPPHELVGRRVHRGAPPVSTSPGSHLAPPDPGRSYRGGGRPYGMRSRSPGTRPRSAGAYGSLIPDRGRRSRPRTPGPSRRGTNGAAGGARAPRDAFRIPLDDFAAGSAPALAPQPGAGSHGGRDDHERRRLPGGPRRRPAGAARRKAMPVRGAGSGAGALAPGARRERAARLGVRGRLDARQGLAKGGQRGGRTLRMDVAR